MAYTLLIYNVILLIAVAMAFGIKCSRGGWEWVLRTILLLTMLIPAAIRADIGTDYDSYVRIFTSHPNRLEYMEIGYALLNRFVQICGGGVEWVFAIAALLTYAPIAYGVRRDWILPVVTLFMLTLYLSSFSLVRQSIAIAWIVVALTRFIDDQRIGQVYLLLLFAACFHTSALFIIPFVLVRRIHIPAWGWLFLLPAIYYIATHGLIDTIFSSDLFLGSKYGKYANSSFNRPTDMGSGLGILLRMLIPLAYIVYSKYFGRKYDIILYTIVAYMVAYMLSAQIHIFNRLVDIFSFAPILAFGALYKETHKNMVIIALAALMWVNFQKTIVSNSSEAYSGLGIAPYKTIFEKERI